MPEAGSTGLPDTNFEFNFAHCRAQAASQTSVVRATDDCVEHQVCWMADSSQLPEPDRLWNLYQIAHSARRWKSGITPHVGGTKQPEKRKVSHVSRSDGPHRLPPPWTGIETGACFMVGDNGGRRSPTSIRRRNAAYTGVEYQGAV